MSGGGFKKPDEGITALLLENFDTEQKAIEAFEAAGLEAAPGSNCKIAYLDFDGNWRINPLAMVPEAEDLMVGDGLKKNLILYPTLIGDGTLGFNHILPKINMFGGEGPNRIRQIEIENRLEGNPDYEEPEPYLIRDTVRAATRGLEARGEVPTIEGLLERRLSEGLTLLTVLDDLRTMDDWRGGQRGGEKGSKWDQLFGSLENPIPTGSGAATGGGKIESLTKVKEPGEAPIESLTKLKPPQDPKDLEGGGEEGGKGGSEE